MPHSPQLRVVRLTPLGRGAVATLLVEGPGAIEVVQRGFRPKSPRALAGQRADRPIFGHFGGEEGEEVVLRCRDERSVELHCHGGLAAGAMIEAALVASGCKPLAWQDWAADHHEDSIAAAALCALADARTQRTAAILLDQYHGALRRALEAIEQARQQGDRSAERQQIDVLLGRAGLGLHLVRPWRVVLAGRRNVGKSSLINALLGYCRMIVHETPGTTRDAVATLSAMDGWPVELIDTAGLGPAADPVEQAGIELARERMAAADLVVLVFDAAAPWTPSDQELLGKEWGLAPWNGEQGPAVCDRGRCLSPFLPAEPLAVFNKIDLLPGTHAASRPAWAPPDAIATSALGGQGIEALARTIVNRLVPDAPPPGAAVPFTADQVEDLMARRSAVVPAA